MEKNNRIFVGKETFFFWILVLLLTVAFNAVLIKAFAEGSYNNGKIVAWVLIHFASFSFFFIVSFAVNRLCNFVSLHDGILKRRGFFFGFNKAVETRSIEEVKMITLHCDGTFYVLLDGISSYDNRLSKKSAIFIPYSEKGFAFIKSFYEGDIPPFC